MRKCQYGDIKVSYYESNDQVENIDAAMNYIVAKVEPDSVERIIKLKEGGFCFHNRTVLGEIDLDVIDKRLFRMIRGDMRTDKTYTEELLMLAEKAFVKDRRFHLDERWNPSLAKKVLKGYINEILLDDVTIFQSFHREKLVGFTVVKNLEEVSCENVLGAVDPLYQNKGVAMSLYGYMLFMLKEKGYKRIYGRISTTNMASINLHIALGAKYSKPEDEYIYRK